MTATPAELGNIGVDAAEVAKGLREERQSIHEEMKKLLAAIKEEKRSLTPEELEKFDGWHSRMDELFEQIQKVERAQKDLERSDHFGDLLERQQWEEKRNPDAPTAWDRDMAFRGFLLAGGAGAQHFTDAHRRAIEKCNANVVAGAEQTRQFDMPAIRPIGGQFTRGRITWDHLKESRAFAREMVQTRATTAQTITTTGGGNLIGNDNSFIARLQEALIMNGTLRPLATVIQTDTGATLPIPGFAGNQSGVNTAISTEVATSDASFSQQTLGRWKYGSMIKLPIELITDSAIDIQSWSGMEIGRRLNRVQEQEFATGAASLSEAEGVLTTGSSGGSAAGSVAQSSAGNITYADLLSLQHDVDPNFRMDSQWVFHDTVLENLRGQLDADNRPLFVPNPQLGVPDTLLGDAYSVNNLYPSFTGATTNESTKLMSYGRHSDYFIRDVRGVAVQVLRERFATSGEVAVIGFAQSFGEYINPHAGSSLSSIKHMVETSS